MAGLLHPNDLKLAQTPPQGAFCLCGTVREIILPCPFSGFAAFLWTRPSPQANTARTRRLQRDNPEMLEQNLAADQD